MLPLPVAPPPRASRLERPEWLKVRITGVRQYEEIRRLVEDKRLNTVCQEARCPNIFECWGEERTATFMLLGDVCTRHCGFCAVGKGRPGTLDPDEPRHVAEAVGVLGVAHAVITSVNRDDLPDGGGAHFAATILAVRVANPGVTVEVLVPDFQGDAAAIDTVIDARPEVFAHNVETVPRLYRRVRPDAIYERSLRLLRRAGLVARDPSRRTSDLPPSLAPPPAGSAPSGSPALMRVKSSLILGLGETFDELVETMRDLRAHGVEIVTLGQYLQPYEKRLPVERYYTPDEFEALRRAGLEMGFAHVESGPLVRSSYHARSSMARALAPQA